MHRAREVLRISAQIRSDDQKPRIQDFHVRGWRMVQAAEIRDGPYLDVTRNVEGSRRVALVILARHFQMSGGSCPWPPLGQQLQIALQYVMGFSAFSSGHFDLSVGRLV